MLSRDLKTRLMATAMFSPILLMAVPALAQQAAATPADASKAGDTVAPEVVVVAKYKERAADVKELEAQNTVTVITASDLVKTPDEDVAAALSRVAGVNAINTGFSGQGNNNIGTAADLPGRGQAEYDSIRGMNAEYNINTINGVNVAQGQAYSREVQFDLLPPTGLQTIVIHKSVGAAADGDAIGGWVDFQTPNAFDFKGVDAMSFTAGLKVEGRALDYGQDPIGESVSVAGSHKFGPDQSFGVYAAAYYDYRNYSNSVIDGQYPAEVNGMYTFAQQTASGASAPGVNPAQNLVLTGLDATLETGYDQRYGGNISLDWHKDANFSAYLRTTYAYETVRQDSYNLQIYGTNIGSAEVGSSAVYTPVISNIQPRYYYETGPEQALLSTFELGADWRSGGWHFSPNLFGSWGEDNEPNHVEFNGREPENPPYASFGGSALFAGTSNGPIPLVSAAEYANIANIGSYGLRRAGEVSTSFSNQGRGGAKIDGGYDFGDGWLHSIDFGVKFESSERNHDSRDYTSGKVFTTNADDPTIASLPFISGSVNELVPGLYNFPIPLVNQSALFTYFNAAAKAAGGINAFSDICNGDLADTLNCNTQRGIEQVTATYIQADLFAGDVEIIPGVRYEHTDIHNDFYVLNANSEGKFASDNSTYDKVLPSISANYRPDSRTVYRAAIWTSYVKPSMFQLGGGEQFSKDDQGNIQITQGNPNLKAIDAINYDVSGEWRNTFGGYAVVSAFYKSLNNFIYDQVDLYTNATTTTTANSGTAVPTFTQISKPLNGGAGDVYGLELTGRQKFTFLASPWDGFGASANLTLERSSVNTGTPGLSTHERLQDQPNTAGNAQLFYEKGPYQVQLSYRYTGDFVSSYASLGDGGPATSLLDTWVKENSRVDLHASYTTPWKVRFDFSVSNLFDTLSFYSTIGKNVNTIPQIVNSGRTFDLTARYSF
jgi:TonB-dependent receptor